MAGYEERTRQTAQRVATVAERGERLSKGIGYGWAADAHVHRGAAFVFVGWALEQLKLEAARMATDPPRDDFEVTTNARPARIKAEDLAPVMQGDPITRLAMDTSLDLDHVAAALSAHVRAFERLQGAVQASASAGTREARASEATRFGIDVAVGIDRTLPVLSSLASTEGPPFDTFERSAPRSNAPADLPNDVLALLYVGGIPIGSLRQVLSVRPPEVPLMADYAELTAPLAELSAELKGWKLPPRWAPPESS